VKASAGAGNRAPTTVAYVIKQGNEYVIAGLANSDAALVQGVLSARAGNLPAARQWLDWARQAAGRPNLTEADFQPALDSATGQIFLSEGKFQEAANVLLRLHQQNPSDKATTYLLAESLIQSNRPSDAKPYIDGLESADPASVMVLRLRANSLAQQGNYAESAAVSKEICARPNASAADWNDLAWTILFTGQNANDAVTAAEKAAELTKFESAAILHTLAIAQANAGRLKEAIATGYKFAALSGDPGEMHTIFGRITEEVGLVEVARQYYDAVSQQDGIRLSNYAFARSRLAGLQKSRTRVQASE
jgi:predicted Zn-dependent protease